MPDHKRQHFLPVVYLGQFGRPLEREPKLRSVWRVSATHAGAVPVGPQCREDYFYSKERASLCESYFGEIESAYGGLIAALGRRETLPPEKLFLLFLCAVDFYARGSKFRVKNEQEEFGRYLQRMEIFKRQLLGPALAAATDFQRRRHILANWEFAVIPFPEIQVLTSDSPSIWFSDSRTPAELRGVLLPLTPKAVFVGVHQGSYRIVRQPGTADDARLVSKNEIENCVEAVYFSDPLDKMEIATIRTLLSRRTVVQPMAAGWPLEWVDYDRNPNLDFIRNADHPDEA